MAYRPGFSGTAFALSIAVAASVGAVAATLLIPREAPAALQSAAALTDVNTQQQDFVDQRKVEVKLSITDAIPLSANTSGIVTASNSSAGQPIASGSSPVAVGGVPILALYTRVPLYRDLVAGARGEDVRALQEELTRLGYDVAVDGYYGWATSEAVRLLKKSIGTTNPDRSLLIAEFVWLPAVSVTTNKWNATLGSSVAAGSPYGVLPGQLTTVSLATVPSTLAPGTRTLTLWGQSTTLDEQNRATDPGFLSALAATEEYPATMASSDAQNPTATLALSEPLPAYKIPPTALFAIEGNSACVQSVDTAIPVTVVGSALGSSLVTLDTSGEALTDVRIGAGITETACR